MHIQTSVYCTLYTVQYVICTVIKTVLFFMLPAIVQDYELETSRSELCVLPLSYFPFTLPAAT